MIPFQKLVFAAAVLAATANLRAQTGLKGFPFTSETLHYSVNWPSGLSLGEGRLSASHSGHNWNFDFTVEASVPGFAVKDAYHSEAVDSGYCSVSFSKETQHGSKRAQELETIDREKGSASRATKGGGKSEFSVSSCAKDALTFLFFARKELGQGRVPPPQQILLGGLYQARLTYVGAETVQVGDKPVLTDKVVCTVKGSTADVSFDAFFDRDPARTPVLIRVPFSMGRFSLELLR